VKQQTFKIIIKWLGILFIAHFVTNWTFSLLFSRDFMITAEWEPDKAYSSLSKLCLVFQFFFTLIFTWFKSYFDDNKHLLKEAMKSSDFTLTKFYLKNYFKDNLIRIAVFAVFQLPFTVYYGFFGTSLITPTIIDVFYIYDVGPYIATNSAVLGFILNPLIFGILLIAWQYVWLIFAKQSLKEIY